MAENLFVRRKTSSRPSASGGNHTLILGERNFLIMSFMKIFMVIKKYLAEFVIIVGTGIFTYNIFSFSHTGGHGGEYGGPPQLPSFSGGYEFEYVAYYYTHTSLLLIAVGMMLVIGGMLFIRNRS